MGNATARSSRDGEKVGTWWAVGDVGDPGLWVARLPKAAASSSALRR